MKILFATFLSTLSLAYSLVAFSFYEDFQDQTAGTLISGSGSNYTDSGVNLVLSPGSDTTGINRKIVDASTPGGLTDPFGGTGNQSLVIDTDSSTTVIPRINLYTPELVSGTISFDLFITLNSAQFHLFSTNGGGTVVDNYGFMIANSSNGLRIADGMNEAGTATNYLTVASTIADATVHHIEINFYENSTYTVSLDGTVLTDGGGKSLFAFVTPQDQLSLFQFTSAWGSTSNVSRYWIDNLTIVPESASASSLIIGGVLFLILGFYLRKNKKLQR